MYQDVTIPEPPHRIELQAKVDLDVLLVRIVARDERALAILYDHCAGRVHGLAARIVHPALADEVVEDTFWQVWREAPRFETARGSALSWILSIARSRAIDAFRRGAVRGRHEVPLDDAWEENAAGASSAFDLLHASERGRRLHGVLAVSEPIHRHLLSLAYFQGLSHQEIATHSGLALGTVKSHLRRGLIQLRRRCTDAGIESVSA